MIDYSLGLLILAYFFIRYERRARYRELLAKSFRQYIAAWERATGEECRHELVFRNPYSIRQKVREIVLQATEKTTAPEIAALQGQMLEAGDHILLLDQVPLTEFTREDAAALRDHIFPALHIARARILARRPRLRRIA